MKVVFFGTPEFAVPSLQRLLAHRKIEVLGVITQPDQPRGRGKKLTPSPVKVCALSHNLPVWQPKRIKKDQEVISQLKQLEADFFAVVAYGQILSQEILDLPQFACVNVHGSILPKYRGAAPIQWCLYHGEKETGITTMLMDVGMDTGAMLLKATIPINLLDNAQTLAVNLADIGADLLVETLVKLQSQTIEPIPQDSTQANYAPLIQKQDYALDWSRSALELHDQVRGFFPNCVANFRGQLVKVISTVPIGPNYWAELPEQFQSLAQEWRSLADLSGDPGEVISIIKRLGPIVQTGSGLLLLQEIQLAGKRVQSGWDFANGSHLTVGEIWVNGSII